MSSWIHFIGKSYYTINSFEKEAAKFGVSRRIDKRLIKKMRYGDKVYVFQKDGKSSKCFGYFVINSVWGKYSPEMMEELDREGKIESNHCAIPVPIKKGCGTFVLCGSSAINCDMDELGEKIEEYGAENVMVGGTFYPMEHIRSAIPHQQGFRRFAADEFLQEAEAVKDTARAKVRGHFYEDAPVVHNGGKFEGDKFINIVEQYQRKGADN